MASNSIIGTPLSELIENGVLLENMQRIAANGKSTYTQMIEILKLLNVVYSPERDFELTSTLKVNVGAIGIVVIKNGKVLITYKAENVYKGIVFKLTDVDYTVSFGNSDDDTSDSTVIKCVVFNSERDAGAPEDTEDYAIGSYAYSDGNIYKLNEEYHWEVVTDNIDDHYIIVSYAGVYFYDNGVVALVSKRYDDTYVRNMINTLDDSLTRQLRELKNTKQDYLVSGTNIKTVNGLSLLGEGNIEIKSSATVLVVSYAGDDPQQKEGAWIKDQIYYDTSNGFFYKCDRTGDVPSTQVEIADGSILYIEQPYAAFYCYDNQIDGEPIPFAKPVDDSFSPTSHNAIENAVVTQRFLEKQDNLDATNGIIIRSKEEEEIDEEDDNDAKLIIELDRDKLDAIVDSLFGITSLRTKVDTIWNELHPTPEPDPDPDPDPQPAAFEPTIGNWGTIRIDKAPEEITVADVMHEDYELDLLADLEDEDISIWWEGDTPPEGKYYITPEKAGLVHYPTGRLDLAYANRKALCDITSNEGTYANCVGLLLGYSGEAEVYYFDYSPGDGTERSCVVNGVTYTYQTADEGLLKDFNHCLDRGIVIKKDFTIKGLTFDSNNKPTSGLIMSATHDNGDGTNYTGGPFFYTRHSLNLIGVKFTQRSEYGCIIIDSVEGINQVQITDCWFTHSNSNLYQKTLAVQFVGRDETPIDAIDGTLKETNCIKDVLIYNNVFDGSTAIQGFVSANGLTNISNNWQCVRFLDSCRIVGNTFSSSSTYAINLAYHNENRSYHLWIAYTQCPVYIVDNTVAGKPGIVDGKNSNTQHCAFLLKLGRTYILRNRISNYVVRQLTGATIAFVYGGCTALYFCRNTCENIAGFSTNRPALILYKASPTPSKYINDGTVYSTVRYIHSNTFKQDIATINTWWTAWLNSGSATSFDTGLDFDTCLAVPVLGYTENVVDNITLKNNIFNLRTIFGISFYSACAVKDVLVEGNTFNFGRQMFYNDNAFSGMFTINSCNTVSIIDNRFVTELSDIRLISLNGTIAGAAAITVEENGVLTGTSLKLYKGTASSSSPTINTLPNNNGYVIAAGDITPEEQAIIDGDTTPVS